MDSVSVRVGQLVKDGAKRRRLRRSLILDKLANPNNWPSKRSRPPCDQCEAAIVSVSFTDLREADSFAPTLENGLREANGRSSGDDRLRQLRSHAGDQGRQGKGRGLRGDLPAAVSGGDIPPRLQIPGIRYFRNVVLELSAHGVGGDIAIHG